MTRYLVPLIALILLAAACGDDDSSEPDRPTPTVSIGLISQEPIATVEPGDVEERVSWRLREEPDGWRLEIAFFIGNDCGYFDRIEVDETGDQVEIAVYTIQKPGVCDDIRHSGQATVLLGEPFGERILDGCEAEGLEFNFYDDVEPGECATAINTTFG